jgi:TPR repeat protein
MPDPNPSDAAFETVARSLGTQSHLAGDAPAAIGRFQIVRPLGRGAFGCVYLASDPVLGREVAIKVPLLAAPDPHFREHFLHEARATATVSHANVCPVFEVEADGNRPYIVMRYVAGGTLADLIRRAPAPMPAPATVRIAKKLALGLAAAHARGVIHRDLKSANVLYDEANDDVLITDFGMAKLCERAGGESVAGIKGTPAYMSPEQVGDGETPGTVGPLSDVYSLGVIFYELLTGQLPFRGPPLSLMLAHAQKKPERPSARVPGLDPRLDALCLHALEKDPAARYPSAKAFADALGAYLRTIGGEEAATPSESVQAEGDFRRGEDYCHRPDEPPDYAAARACYERAAAHGHAGAQHALGHLYEEALGVPRDYAKAVEFYTKAAAQGHAEAQHALGHLYQHAPGVPHDPAVAAMWYARAAAQGHRAATNALGYLYAVGLGVPRDAARSQALYDLAAPHAPGRHADPGCIYMEGADDDQECVNIRLLYERAAGGDEAARQALTLWLGG